jgi:hypothetical protein
MHSHTAENKQQVSQSKSVSGNHNGNRITMPAVPVLQRKLQLEGSNDPSAAYHRRDNAKLNELKDNIEAINDICLFQFASSNFFAKEETDELRPTVKTKVQIPDSSGQPEDNLYSTVHELTHAQAILSKSYDIAPHIFHIVYAGGQLEIRELIPLEEALTVGFEDSGNKIHELRSTDSYKLLQYFTEDDWSKLVPKKWPKVKKRFERIFPLTGRRDDSNPENIVENSSRPTDKKRHS